MQQIYLREQCHLNYFVCAEYKLFTLAYNIAVYCYMIVCLFHCMDNIILYYVETIVFNKKISSIYVYNILLIPFFLLLCAVPYFHVIIEM